MRVWHGQGIVQLQNTYKVVKALYVATNHIVNNDHEYE